MDAPNAETRTHPDHLTGADVTDPDEYVPCPRHGTRCFREIPDLARRIECAIGLGDRGPAGVKSTTEHIMMMIEDHTAELAGRLPIEELGLDVRTYSVLANSHRHIRHVGELLRMTEDDVTDLRNAGTKTLENVKDRLREEFGLALRQQEAP